MYVMYLLQGHAALLAQSNIQNDQQGEREALERGEGLEKGGIGERVVLAKPKNIYRFTALPAVALVNYNRRESTFADFLRREENGGGGAAPRFAC
jgi:hypothetical protein